MKFKNNQPHDVYIDLGGLRRVAAGEVIELQGALSCSPLTPIFETLPSVPSKKAAPRKPIKKVTLSGTT